MNASARPACRKPRPPPASTSLPSQPLAASAPRASSARWPKSPSSATSRMRDEGTAFAQIKINPEALVFVMPPADGVILTSRFRQSVLGDEALFN